MIVLVMGVSGAGKSTLAEALAQRLGWTYLDADALHSPANVAKMRAGQPLTDADRAPWLQALAERLRAAAQSRVSLVLACSALKVAYRQTLRQDIDDWRLIYLRGDPAALHERLARRQGHYMPPALLQSQLDTLQEPLPEEHALILDATDSATDNLERAVATVRAATARAE